MEDYPNRIYELRRARGLSQEALGEAIGVTKMSISRMERGLQEITLEQLRRMGNALGVAPADLLSVQDNPHGLRNEREYRWMERYRVADEDQRETLDRVSEAVVPYGAPDQNRAA